MAMKILVTGTNSGFGDLITRTLLARGHTVVASMRDIQGRNQAAAAALREAGAHVVDIDVTSEASVAAGVAAGLEAAGGLDAVVNNAGIGVLGLQEAFTPGDWQRLFDVNVFGVQRVNRAALPTLRAQGRGVLMHVSSLLGRFVLPFMGPYNASKWALEAMAENYRVELSGLGIETVVIEPGGFGTDFGQRLLTPGDGERLAQLGDYAQAPEQMMTEFAKNFEGDDAPDPQWVADRVAEVLEMPHGRRPFRSTVDGLGMGEPIAAYNDQYEQMLRGMYEHGGMQDMLAVRSAGA